MRRTSRLLVVFGIGLAVLTFVLIVALLPGGGCQGSNCPTGGATPSPAPVTVVVAATNIPLGTVVTADMLSTQTLPAGQVKAGAFTNTSQVIGQVARQALVSGEQVASDSFAADQATISVPAGKRGLAVAVNELTGVGNLIYPGDYVDVVITLDANAIPVISVQPPNKSPFTHDQALAPVTVKASALLQDIQVLGTLQAAVAPPAAGASAAPSQGPSFNGSPTTKLVILAVDDNQAEAILFARYFNTLVANASNGASASINLVLRSPADASAPPVNTNGVDLRTMFDRYGVVPPFIQKAIDAYIAQQP